MALTLTRGGRRVSHQPLRHNMPVGPVEELLLHMVVQAGPWRMWRVFLGEDELGRFVLPRAQAAHRLAILSCFPIAPLLTTSLPSYALAHPLCHSMARLFGPAEWQVCP